MDCKSFGVITLTLSPVLVSMACATLSIVASVICNCKDLRPSPALFLAATTTGVMSRNDGDKQVHSRG